MTEKKGRKEGQLPDSLEKHEMELEVCLLTDPVKFGTWLRVELIKRDIRVGFAAKKFQNCVPSQMA